MQDDILIEDGLLVLADISGFTAFVAASELEHGAQVTGTLLETVMRRLSPPLEIQELEGDAVFAIGPDRIITDASTVPTLLAGAFAAFREQQHRLASDVSCACGACRETARLNLKLIAHHGRFVRQLVGGRPRVTGPDVVLAHRLLKNSVGTGAYLLLTEPALERIGMDPVAGGMRRHLVSYPHLGEVPCFVGDLESVPQPALAGVDVPAAWDEFQKLEGHSVTRKWSPEKRSVVAVAGGRTVAHEWLRGRDIGLALADPGDHRE